MESINLQKKYQNSKIKLLIFFFSIALFTWAVDFYYFKQFGIYDDDHYTNGRYIHDFYGSGLLGIFENLFKEIIFKFFVGRPIGIAIMFLINVIGAKIGGLNSIYVINYILVLFTNILFFLLLKKLWNQNVFLLCGTLAFILFPANNVRVMLSYECISVALIFLLLAFLSYFNNKIKSYIFIFLALCSYETSFLLYLITPLFTENVDKKIIKKLFIHNFICSIIFTIYTLIRRLHNDSRVLVDLFNALKWSIHNTVVGPLVSIYMYFYRVTTINYTREIIVICSITCLVFLFGFLNLKKEKYSKNLIFLKSKKLIILSISMIVLSYPLTLTVPAEVINGIGSRVHVFAGLGDSILFGLITVIISDLAAKCHLKRLFFIILSFYFSLLIGFGLTVQLANVKSFDYQKAFWTDVLNLAPDISKENIILVDSPSLKKVSGSQLSPFGYVLPAVLEYTLFEFPNEWFPRPCLYELTSDWKQNFSKNILPNGKLKLNQSNGLVEFYPWWDENEWVYNKYVYPKDIILLEEKNGKLIRVDNPILIGSKIYEFKTKSQSRIQTYKKTILYNDFILKNPPKINYFENFNN